MVRPSPIMALIAVIVVSVPAVAGSLETLMTDLAKVEERRAVFVEERTISVLDERLITEGTLSYQAPDRLIRQDLIPDPAVYTLDGDRLHVVVDGNEQVLALDQEPLLRAMVAPFQAIFAGDLGALDHEFDATYAEQGDRWTVTLTPKAAASSSRFLDRILMTGTGGNVEQVDTYEHNGDRTSMRLDERAAATSVKP